MPYAENIPFETHPSGDAQNGIDKSSDSVVNDKTAEIEQAADGIILASCQLHRCGTQADNGQASFR